MYVYSSNIFYLLQDTGLASSVIWESAPTRDSGHVAVIVGGGGGKTDWQHSVIEGNWAGQLDDGEVIVKGAGVVAWMAYPLASTKYY